jgi:hypothetical protein
MNIAYFLVSLQISERKLFYIPSRLMALESHPFCGESPGVEYQGHYGSCIMSEEMYDLLSNLID